MDEEEDVFKMGANSDSDEPLDDEIPEEGIPDFGLDEEDPDKDS